MGYDRHQGADADAKVEGRIELWFWMKVERDGKLWLLNLGLSVR
jgi:hypothetical protein